MYINSLRKELKFTRGCQDEILLCKAVIDPLFKYDVRKKVLTPITKLFLFVSLFLNCKDQVKKKCFCWLDNMNVKRKKMLNKNKFVCPPKNENVPQIFVKGTNCPQVIKS